MPNTTEDATIIPPVTTIAEYTATAVALATLAEKYKGVTFDTMSTAGMKSAIEGRAELRGYRVALEKKRKEIKTPALERCKQIDAEAARITVELESLEKPIDQQIKDEESRKEREKTEKIEAELKRRADVQALIAQIRAIPSMPMVGSEAIAAYLEQTKAIAVPAETYMEFTAEAELAKTTAIDTLTASFDAALVTEQEQRQIIKDREELAELRKTQAETQRLLDEANAIEQKRLDDAKAILDEERRVHDQKVIDDQAELDRIAAKAEEDRKAEESRLARIKFDEETKRQLEEEEKQKALDKIADDERLAREKTAREEKEAAEQKAKDAAKAQKIAEKAAKVSAAKCETASIAFHKILTLCNDHTVSSDEARSTIAIIAEGNL